MEPEIGRVDAGKEGDFVIIDPVSTGYSRAEGDTSEKEFHGLESDLDAVADFIRLYLTREERWSSPKIIAGESYGTTRAAGLMQRLHSRHGIATTGVLLVSPVLEFQTIRFGEGNDLPFPMFLPSYTATAHYHNALPEKWQSRPVDEAITEARRFALDEYLPALLRGAALSAAERNSVRTTLSEMTGIDPQYLEDAGLRLTQGRFSKELLRHRNQTVGRLDARFIGIDGEHVGERYTYDASYEAIRSNYTEALNAYIREELRYESDLYTSVKQQQLIITNQVTSLLESSFTLDRYFEAKCPVLSQAQTPRLKHLNMGIEQATFNIQQISFVLL